MSGVLLVCAAATSSLAQTPGWSRGQQLLPITYDQCVSRASQALQAEGFRIDHAAGDFAVGIKEVHDDIWLVSFMEYDLGYFDLETKVLEPLQNPFGPKVLPM